jgi:hypothetical protein
VTARKAVTWFLIPRNRGSPALRERGFSMRASWPQKAPAVTRAKVFMGPFLHQSAKHPQFRASQRRPELAGRSGDMLWMIRSRQSSTGLLFQVPVGSCDTLPAGACIMPGVYSFEELGEVRS